MRKSLIVILPVLTFFVLATAFQFIDNTPEQSYPGDKITIPEDVSTILDNSCFGCHNTESQNDKGKKKLSIDTMGDLTSVKLVAKLSEISDVVNENEMPPEKFLSKYPDKALSAEDAKRLTEWADATAEELMK